MADTKKKIDPAEAFERQKVPVFIPKTTAGDKSDMVVSVNGKTWVAQRGKTVYMPRYAARVLQRSIQAEDEAQAYIDRKASNR